jgi:hypothetical protein
LGILKTGETTEVFVTTTIQASSHKFNSLTPGVAYKVRIKVNNLVGESPYSALASATPGIELTRPGLLTFTASTRTTLDLKWSALTGEDTGGTVANPIAVSKYHIEMDDGHGGAFKLIASTDGSVALPTYQVKNMSPGLYYKFRTRAESLIKLISGYSTVQTMPAGVVPSAPTKPKLVK